MRPVVWLTLRELGHEWRVRDTVPGMLVFVGLLVVVFGLAYDPVTTPLRPVFAGVLWLGYAFVTVLGTTRAFAAEREGHVVEGLRLAGVDGGALFAAKLVAHVLYQLLLQLVGIPAMFALLYVRFTAPLWPLAEGIVLTDVGLVACGLLVSAVSHHGRWREMLAPLLMFPLWVPVLLAGVQVVTLAQERDLARAAPWFSLLLAYDAIFVAAGVLGMEYVLEG